MESKMLRFLALLERLRNKWCHPEPVFKLAWGSPDKEELRAENLGGLPRRLRRLAMTASRSAKLSFTHLRRLIMLKDKGILKAIWAGMFVVCCVLGFIPDPGAGGQIVMVAMAGLFFVPAYADAYFAWKNRDHKELRLIRNLCILSLGSTLVVLVANLLSLLTSSLELGDALYYLLVVVSTPMICGRYWVYSLLLWAILLWCCIAALRPEKRK
jgi:hypothetical protein